MICYHQLSVHWCSLMLAQHCVCSLTHVREEILDGLQDRHTTGCGWPYTAPGKCHWLTVPQQHIRSVAAHTHIHTGWLLSAPICPTAYITQFTLREERVETGTSWAPESKRKTIKILGGGWFFYESRQPISKFTKSTVRVSLSWSFSILKSTLNEEMRFQGTLVPSKIKT